MKPGYKRLSRWVRRLTKIFEVVFWLFFGALCYFFLAFFFLTVNDPAQCSDVALLLSPGSTLSTPQAIVLVFTFLAFSIVYFALTARLWRHIRKVFETTEGLTPASIGPTPFQAENVRLLKKIAACAITMEVLNALFLFIAPGKFSFTNAAASAFSGVLTSAAGIAFGLIIFCLAHFFAYGIQLQLDTDGLV